jgi:hypothetical protein
MKKWIIVCLTFSLITACDIPSSTAPIRVAYLVQEGGQFSQSELSKHPEILVTSDFEEFKQAARQRVALWIDKNATQLIEEGWLDTMPQASYPIILIGYNNTLLSFRDTLRLCCFLGPQAPDYSDAEPGFSVIKRDSGELFAPITMLQGFRQSPTIDDILKISIDLLDGKITPTPRPTPPENVPTWSPQ